MLKMILGWTIPLSLHKSYSHTACSLNNVCCEQQFKQSVSFDQIEQVLTIVKVALLWLNYT